jgi:signal-transduction protein with cAMP-binding, CBS, and nucleotidyltransferase domain
MTTVSEMLRSKGYETWSVAPGDTVLDALKVMAAKNIGAVLVMDGDNLLGVLSERDYARKVILMGRASKDTAVQEIMTERVICVRPEETAEECMALMTDKRVRHLPVVDDDHVMGVISIGDVVKSIIAEKEFVIEQLEHYIRGTPYVPPQPAPCDVPLQPGISAAGSQAAGSDATPGVPRRA